ncbi:MAG: sugar transferase [Syntrophobacteraceae bacterium]|nr:sugar transferase [Syntrophobacteraceae bacterium]
MKDLSSAAVAKFAPVCERTFSGRRSECDDLYTIEYNEEAFQKILVLERKRSERSKRPFVLMLLDVATRDESCGAIREKVLSCLAETKRDTDILGWYRQDSIAGIIFTEISSSNGRAPSVPIAERIKAGLAGKLGPEGVNRAPISFFNFSEKSRPQVLSGRLTLYPDIRERLNAHKRGLSIKRAIDVCGALIGLVLLAPFFLVISAMIKLTSKGPVFFRQERVGQYGDTFMFLKFRSMYVNNDPSIHKEYTKSLILAEEKGAGNGAPAEGAVFKIQNDPRVTPVGRFLRRSSLDEIPQLINVLAGRMSLVGPRPPIPYELENYDLWHWRRVLEMKPGITGMWQVGGRSRTTFDEMVRLDLNYMTQWSLRLDMKILFMTPLAVLSGKGAY